MKSSVRAGCCTVRAQINVTPIHFGEGELVSALLTMQDLAPFEELGRQRADFRRIVSHELRARLGSIKRAAQSVLEVSSVVSRAKLLEFFVSSTGRPIACGG